MIRSRPWALVVFLALGAPAGAEEPALLAGAAGFYAQQDYPHALELLERARNQCRSSRELAKVALYQGAVEAQAGRPQDGQDSFQLALFLWPEAELPLRVSPKVQVGFDALKQRMQRERGTGATEALAAAEAAFARADFEGAIAATFRALSGGLAPGQRQRCWELQAFGHAAYGRTASAVEAFRRVLASEADYALGPEESPRLRALLAQARSEGPWREQAVSSAPVAAVVEPASPPWRERAWIPAAAGAVLGVAGAGCLIASNSRFKELTGSPALPEPAAQADVSQGKLLQGLGVATLVTAAVSLAVGGALYAWGEGGTGSGSVTLGPAAGGVALRWP